MANLVPKVTLQNGLLMPVLGLGTYKSKPEQVTEAVEVAIDLGYRHLDCAHIYQNEKEIGAALKKKLDENVTKREDLWITSKLWNTDHEPHLVEKAIRTTLSNLGLEYLDLYLMHRPYSFQSGTELIPVDEKGNPIMTDIDYLDTWKAMEELVRKGLTRSIGLSNFNSEQVERVIQQGTIHPVVNQVECHPYLNQKKLAEFCTDRNVALTAYTPLGRPEDGPHAGRDVPVLLQDRIIKEISGKHNKTPAQILIRYQIQAGNIVIPKSVTKSRIQENIQVFDFDLTSDDMEAIDSLNRNFRIFPVEYAKAHKYYPFNTEF